MPNRYHPWLAPGIPNESYSQAYLNTLKGLVSVAGVGACRRRMMGLPHDFRLRAQYSYTASRIASRAPTALRSTASAADFGRWEMEAREGALTRSAASAGQ